MIPIRQNFPDRRLADIPGTVRRELSQSGFGSRLKPGARIAIGIGSRGIANISTIAGAVVNFWKSAGFQPFIFPAMGSHGAATAEGQADVLAHYGIHEATMGCPVISTLEVVPLGATPEGIETFMDRAAFESDGVMLVPRVKPHTDFAGEIESGLFKMMAIGLGKFAGAQRYHTFAYRMGLENMIRTVGRQVLASGKILGGLAIIEDACHNTGHLEAVPVEDMERREKELLALAKSWLPRIPVEHADILIVDEIGKNISGAGMDTKVVNRSVNGEYNPWRGVPRFDRVFVRDLSPGTYGNAVGIGMADVIHDRILVKVDWAATHVNSLTASTPACIRTPIHFGSDRECLERITPTVGKFDAADVTFVEIRNTLELGLLRITENLRPEIEGNSQLRILSGPDEMAFDARGDLLPWGAAAHEEGNATDGERGPSPSASESVGLSRRRS